MLYAGLDVLPSCNTSLLANEILDRCYRDRPTARCCEPVMPGFVAGKNASCICLVMLSNQMQLSLMTIEEVLRYYRLCSGRISYSSDVCDNSPVAETASPPPSALSPVPAPSQPAAVNMSQMNKDKHSNGKQQKIT